MPIIICPGIHSPRLSDCFVSQIKHSFGEKNYLILPTTEYSPYSSFSIEEWLKTYYPSPMEAPPLSLIAFSAGVVGAMGAALAWQFQGGRIKCLIALDGWGMVLGGDFPIYRISHDYFTHWSSAILGGGENGFYAEPGVSHLDLWRSPDNCWGWQEISPGCKIRSSLINYLEKILGENE